MFVTSFIVPTGIQASVGGYLGDATPLAHVLGRLGPVDATDVATDPNSDDPFAK